MFESADSLNTLFSLLCVQTGHDFSQYKSSTIERRVRRRMAVQKIDTPEAYLDYARQEPVEVDALFNDILIGVTGFFRDPDAFRTLDELVVRPLVERAGDDRPIRVWVPGCSTGQEAYSIAMLFRDRLDLQNSGTGVEIFATDIDARAIETARCGTYPASMVADIPARLLSRHFDAGPGLNSYSVNKAIRDIVTFSEHDVMRDAPFSTVDLISCRNLLIYMKLGLQQRLIEGFHSTLEPGRFLFLGASESLGEQHVLFTTIDRKQKIFRRVDDIADTRRGVSVRAVPVITVSEGRSGPSEVWIGLRGGNGYYASQNMEPLADGDIVAGADMATNLELDLYGGFKVNRAVPDSSLDQSVKDTLLFLKQDRAGRTAGAVPLWHGYPGRL